MRISILWEAMGTAWPLLAHRPNPFWPFAVRGSSSKAAQVNQPDTRRSRIRGIWQQSSWSSYARKADLCAKDLDYKKEAGPLFMELHLITLAS